MDETQPLESLLDKAIDSADGDKLRVGEILDAYGSRSFGPVIAILALIVCSPIGGIPFLPMIFAALILLIAVQLLVGRKHPWVPDAIKGIGVDIEKAKSFRKKAGGTLDKVDALISPRLEWAAGDMAQYAAMICVCFLCLIMAAPPLELIPFAVAVPGAAILLFGLGLTAKDGLLMILGFAATAAAAWLGYSWIFGGKEGGEDSAGLVAPVIMAFA